MALRLICALPEPGCPGAPRGLFYEDNAEGRALAQEFARREDRPGFGVFEPLNPISRDVDFTQSFEEILKLNGFHRDRG